MAKVRRHPSINVADTLPVVTNLGAEEAERDSGLQPAATKPSKHKHARQDQHDIAGTTRTGIVLLLHRSFLGHRLSGEAAVWPAGQVDPVLLGWSLETLTSIFMAGPDIHGWSRYTRASIICLAHWLLLSTAHTNVQNRRQISHILAILLETMTPSIAPKRAAAVAHVHRYCRNSRFADSSRRASTRLGQGQIRLMHTEYWRRMVAFIRENRRHAMRKIPRLLPAS
ncbi:uncharacterized protein BJ171DRAFT_112679 [Polychytrium aggregatum]|uniref:uncharacterized protein n=1 Tax=Polychytrium aggregatum TaxID=110093 RepID=UPI0022FDDE06|nr:uncharacterized protein BJ171DRAFT_112679 [Polychytrium aggregatum]KAI9209291.1 hypothetical protein BJ171DRAFT_112679 [Polychytrium aggregatum]